MFSKVASASASKHRSLILFYMLTYDQIYKVASRPSRPLASLQCLKKPLQSRFTPIQLRLLSTETKAAIDKAVGSAPVVLFMKGTPETPQCGFSRVTIQILGLQGVDPQKFTAFNVLEDESLRQGKTSGTKCARKWLLRFV